MSPKRKISRASIGRREHQQNTEGDRFYSLLPESLAKPWEGVDVTLVPDISSLRVDKGARQTRITHHSFPLLLVVEVMEASLILVSTWCIMW